MSICVDYIFYSYHNEGKLNQRKAKQVEKSKNRYCCILEEDKEVDEDRFTASMINLLDSAPNRR